MSAPQQTRNISSKLRTAIFMVAHGIALAPQYTRQPYLSFQQSLFQLLQFSGCCSSSIAAGVKHKFSSLLFFRFFSFSLLHSLRTLPFFPSSHLSLFPLSYPCCTPHCRPLFIKYFSSFLFYEVIGHSYILKIHINFPY